MKILSILFNNVRISVLAAATFVLLPAAATFGQAVRQPDAKMWQSVKERSLDRTAKRLIVPMAYRTVRLDKAALAQALAGAPMEFTREATENPAIIYLPMPDGTMARFRFEESPIMEPGLAAKFPGFKTYRAQGIDDPTATSRFDWLPTGFHAIILAPSGTVLIDPYAEGNTTDYITYWKRDAANTTQGFECDFVDLGLPSLPESDIHAPAVTSGTTLRTYRLALAATNEYTVAVGSNTVAGALAAEVLIMNRVNGVYERDLAIHMNIVANNNLITYAGDNLSCGGACTTANDPYTNNNGSTMLGQNQTTIDAVIGTANYDIGHVFSTGGGGVASVGVPCGSSKARGVTGLSNPVGDPFAIDYVAHEMGHQWGALHTFNGTVSNCGGGNRSASAAYEPGSGITIMAYAGICGNQNLSDHSIDTFHVKSLEQIVAFSQTGNGNNCAVATATGNTAPTVTGPGNFTIPKGTPFSLTASATDPNGDSITYDWEEYDLGAATTAVPNTDSDGNARPILRPYLPTTGGTRTFPSLQYILNNANVPPATTGGFLTGELLPAISRAMTFQVVARDNRANGGGINTATSVVTIDGAAGPFAVTAPNTGISIPALTNFNVTWNASGNAANVKISLSTDGGNTFPTVLAASTPNDGTESVLIPNMPTTTARIKVEAVGNIFFDISDTNFSITGNAPLALTTAVSRKDHGGAGTFDINLPVSDPPGVECRSGGAGGDHTLVMTFTNSVVSGNATVTSGTGSVVGTPTFSDNTMTINLTGVANAQTVTVTLSNVTDSFSQTLPDTAVSASFLVGDTNGSGSVNASDVSQTKGQLGEPVTSSNFRTDVNVNGTISASDIALVKSNSGTSNASYLIGSFFTSPSLQLMASEDGLNWIIMRADAYTPPSGDFRDPSIIKLGSTLWIVYTTAYSGATGFGLAKSIDGGFTWSFVRNVTVDGAATNTWAPEWFMDSDGSVHVLVGIETDTSNGGNMHIFELHPTPSDPSGAWSAPVSIDGLQGWHQYDASITKIGNTYNIIYTDGGEAVRSTAGTLLGPYSNNTHVSFGGFITHVEGMSVFPMEQGYGMVYIDLELGPNNGMNFSTSSDLLNWSAPTLVNSLVPHLNHGTALRVSGALAMSPSVFAAPPMLHR